MKIPKERVIYSNYDLSEQFPDEAIREIWEDIYTEEDIENMIDSDYWDERYNQDEINWDEARAVLNKYFNNANSLIAIGSVGRWNGVVSGEFEFSTLDELMSKAAKDCYLFKFYDENGHLFLHCSHHDGSCQFEIKEITEHRNKRLLRIAEKEWGCPAREYEPITKESIKRKINNSARSFYC